VRAVGCLPVPAVVPFAGGDLHGAVRAGEASGVAVGGAGEPPFPGDAPPLAFRGTAPHSVVDAVPQRVLEAGRLHRAGRTDAPGQLHSDAVAGEERRRRMVTTVPLAHPVGAHRLAAFLS